MIYEVCPIDQIRPYEINNKIHTEPEIEKLARSLDEFGWTQPICVDEHKIILAGHRRFFAAQKRGLTELPIVIKEGLTDEQKRSYRLIDNSLSAYPHWDYENINQEMFFLKSKDAKFVDDLLAEFLNKEKFAPNTDPTQASSVVSEEELKKKEAQLAEQFKNSQVKFEVCCPECGNVFGIDK
jgi:ParB/RepB/Spo0J family partition protein